ncbi:MAG: hypothetical protein M3220_08510 [Chloroflexota bacterium]|nr:hypothetical protein [Chloroflexota bacterium]
MGRDSLVTAIVVLVSVSLLAAGLCFWLFQTRGYELEVRVELVVGDATPTETAGVLSTSQEVSNTLSGLAARVDLPSATLVTPAATPLATATPKPTATTPPASPTATHTVEPTATLVPPTATPSPFDVLEQVARAEAALQTGQFEVTINFEDGNHATAHILFDFANETETPRLRMVTTYESSTGTQTVEHVMIGSQSWQRQGDGVWRPLPNQEGVWGQVQSFLPHSRLVAGAELQQIGDATVLHWYDADRATDMNLYVHPETGVPEKLHEVRQHSSLTRTVLYKGWNEPVEIASPVTN